MKTTIILIILCTFFFNNYSYSQSVVQNIGGTQPSYDNILESDQFLLEQKWRKLGIVDNNLWETVYAMKGKVVYINPELDIVLVYYSHQSFNLYAIKISTQEKLWSRHFYQYYGWEDFKYLNDSVLLVESRGLHAIRLSDGRGWDFNGNTHLESYTPYANSKVKGEIIANIALGILLGQLTGSYIYYSNYDDEYNVYGLSSNSIIDDDKIYFADFKKLSCIGLYGQTIWSTPLVKKENSRSQLFLIDEQIIQVNYGYAMSGKKKIIIGKPYVAKYDKQTGDFLVKRYLNSDAPVTDIFVSNDTIHISLGEEKRTVVPSQLFSN